MSLLSTASLSGFSSFRIVSSFGFWANIGIGDMVGMIAEIDAFKDFITLNFLLDFTLK